MQKINNIEIKNFKSIRQAEIKDCRKVNLFVGYPNVGKSNVLEALGLFCIDKLSSDFSNYVRIEAPTTLFFDGDISQQVEVKINKKHRIIAYFTKDGITFEKQFEIKNTSFEKYDSGVHYEDNSNRVLGVKKFSVRNADKENLIINQTEETILFDENKLPAIKKYLYNKNIEINNQGYLQLTAPFGDNLFNVVKTNKQLKKDVEEILNNYNLKFSFDTTKQSFTILKFIGSDIFSIPYSMVADTLKRLIFNKAAILSNDETVIVFEEPEAHMFPPFISKFTNDIINSEKNNQYFMATHSSIVLNDFMEHLDKEDLSIYTVGYKDGETIIHRMTNTEIDEVYKYGVDLFFNLEDYLNETIS